jgi:hypothetical protein
LTVSLDNLIARVRTLADIPSSSHVTNAEITDFLNVEGAEYHDLLIQADLYNMIRVSFTVTGSTGPVAIPVTDFQKVMGIDKVVSGRDVALGEWSFNERGLVNSTQTYAAYWEPVPFYKLLGQYIYFYPESSMQGTYKLWYMPRWRDLVSGSFTTLPDVYTTNHWEDYMVLGAAARCALKEESTDANAMLEQKKVAFGRKIQSVAPNRSTAGFGRVQDVPMMGPSMGFPWEF